MSSVAQLQQNYRDARARMWGHPDARQSDERIEVVSEAKRRQRQIDDAKRAEVRAKLDEVRSVADRLKDEERTLLARLKDVRASLEAIQNREVMSQYAVEDGVKVITFDQIARAVCQHFEMPSIYVFGQRRTSDLARMRMIIMYLARELTAMSFPQIGQRCGGRDHTTAIHAAKRVHAMMLAGDEKLLADIAAIRKALGL